MCRWSFAAVGVMAALACGCGNKSTRKVETELEDEAVAADDQGEAEAGNEVTVTVVVVIAGTDDDGKTTAVELLDEPNFQWYLVAEGGRGKELFELVDKTVKITGTVEEDKRGEKTITVMRYEVVAAEGR